MILSKSETSLKKVKIFKMALERTKIMKYSLPKNVSILKKNVCNLPS